MTRGNGTTGGGRRGVADRLAVQRRSHRRVAGDDAIVAAGRLPGRQLRRIPDLQRQAAIVARTVSAPGFGVEDVRTIAIGHLSACARRCRGCRRQPAPVPSARRRRCGCSAPGRCWRAAVRRASHARSGLSSSPPVRPAPGRHNCNQRRNRCRFTPTGYGRQPPRPPIAPVLPGRPFAGTPARAAARSSRPLRCACMSSRW